MNMFKYNKSIIPLCEICINRYYCKDSIFRTQDEHSADNCTNCQTDNYEDQC